LKLPDFPALTVDLVRIRSISRRMLSSCITFSLGQSLFDLPENNIHRATFPCE
jgi:hypothetical protein